MIKPHFKPGCYVVRGKEFSNVEEAEFYAVGRMVQDEIDAKPDFALRGPDFIGQWVVNMIFDNCQVSIRSGK